MRPNGDAEPRSDVLVRRMLALLERQQELAERLEALARRQHEVVGDDQGRALADLLGRREELVRALEDAEAALRPLRAMWSGGEVAADTEERRQVQRRCQAIAATLARIAEQDAAMLRRLEQERERLAETLAGLTRGREAMAAYGDPPLTPLFQDRKG